MTSEPPSEQVILRETAEPEGAPVLESRLAPQLKAVLLAGALVAAVLIFQALTTLVLLVLVTVLIAIPLAAFAGLLERFRIPRPVGALLALAIGVGVIAGIVRIIIPPLARELRSLASDAPAALENLRVGYLDLIGGGAGAGAREVRKLVDRFLDQPFTVIEPLLSVGLGVIGVFFTSILLLLTAYYTAVRPGPLLDGIVSLFPPARRPWAVHIMARLRTAWIGWLKGVVVDMLVSGVLLYMGLTLIGLDFALVFAVLSALLVVIPYFGAIIGGIPPVLLALTDSPERALLVLLVYVAVQQIEGNLIIPLVMSQTVRLHPAVIAVGVVAVGALFGLVGLFVAVPVLSTVQILIDELWVRPAERAHERRPGAAAGESAPAEASVSASDGEAAAPALSEGSTKPA